MSKGKNGSGIKPDTWGRGHSESYKYIGSSYKPGFFIGAGLKSSVEKKAYVSFSVNYQHLQNRYNYSGYIYDFIYSYSLSGDVVCTSNYIYSELLLNLNCFFLKKARIYIFFGPAAGGKLSTTLSGTVVREKTGYNFSETQTLEDDQISWDTHDFYLSGVVGCGTSLTFLKRPIDIQFAYTHALTDLYEYPNLKTASFNFTINFHLVRIGAKN